MVYYNRLDGDYMPTALHGIDRGVSWQPADAVENRDGLYYRSRIFPGLAELVGSCMDGTVPFTELSIDAYQSWVESGWKAPHGTLHAAKRLRMKGSEEHRELDDALEEYWETGNADHLLEEAGDNLWIATARSSNGGNVIGDSIKERLYEYIAGTKVYDLRGQPVEPEWYDSVAQLSIRRGSPTIGDIDAILEDGFVARMSPVMNLYDEEEFSPTGAVFDLLMFNGAASGLNIHQHEKDEDELFATGPSYEKKAHDIGIFTSETYFRIASTAHYVGSTLARVVEMNMRKIDQRISDGLIDKTDGPRTIE